MIPQISQTSSHYHICTHLDENKKFRINDFVDAQKSNTHLEQGNLSMFLKGEQLSGQSFSEDEMENQNVMQWRAEVQY